VSLVQSDLWATLRVYIQWYFDLAHDPQPTITQNNEPTRTVLYLGGLFKASQSKSPVSVSAHFM